MDLTPADYKIYDSTDFPSYLPKLHRLYDDLFSGGKGFRSKLTQTVGSTLSLSPRTLHLLGQTIEFIHNASLLHDDLIDRSHLRRGKPAAWTKYTPEYAVLAGDYLLARVMVHLSHFGNINLVQYTAEMISHLLEGEWLQDSLIGDFSVDTSQLDRVHNFKTASLFKWCLRAPFIAKESEGGQYHSSLHSLLDEIGTILGQLFQRSDDLLDFDVRNDEGKAILGDLKSGYLNSFAAFCAQGLNRNIRTKMKECQSLGDFFVCLGGEGVFNKRLEEFDQQNIFLIQLYQHHLKNLDAKLNGKEKTLVLKLEPLTDILYWRKKPK